MKEPPLSPSKAEDHPETDTAKLFTHTIISSPDSIYTLEHKRVVQEENKVAYCVRFEPDESKYLAVGYSDGTIGIFKSSTGHKYVVLGTGTATEQHRPIGCLRYFWCFIFCEGGDLS
jgi:hypothetical protein